MADVIHLAAKMVHYEATRDRYGKVTGFVCTDVVIKELSIFWLHGHQFGNDRFEMLDGNVIAIKTMPVFLTISYNLSISDCPSAVLLCLSCGWVTGGLAWPGLAGWSRGREGGLLYL